MGINITTSNYIRDLIFKSLVVSRDSKVPVLFFSNPGLGKTSNMRTFCETYGYKMEELRGASSSPEEILGYKVNESGKDSLTTKYPDWFDRILDGKKTNNDKYILFIDEITTASEYTQAALLKIIFDRAINDRILPEDTLIVAAGNYKGNLSGQFNLLPPTLNRFMLINLKPQNPLDLIEEFVGYNPNRIESVPKYDYNPIDESVIERCANATKEFLNGIVNIYSNVNVNKNGNDNARGFVDISNTNFDGIFDDAESYGGVFGFISGRTMHYLNLVTRACYKNGIMNGDEFVLGLIGLGTNNFNTEQLKSYQKDIIKKYNSMLSNVIQKKNKVTKKFTIDDKKPIYNLCNEFTQMMQEGNPEDYEVIGAAKLLAAHIKNKYKDLNATVIELGKRNDTNEIRKYVADHDSIKMFAETIRELSPDAFSDCNFILRMHSNYYNGFVSKLNK
jgi:hypothetical protein